MTRRRHGNPDRQLVTLALPGDYGKPRPALIIPSDFFSAHPSLTVLPVTRDLCDKPLFRISVEPSPENGLSRKSQVMVDKCMTVSREKLGAALGCREPVLMLEVERGLAVFPGIAKYAPSVPLIRCYLKQKG